MQEILVIVAIGLAVLIIPRLMNRNASSESRPSAHTGSQPRSIVQFLKTGLPGWVRLLIMISALWIAGCAVYLKPWEQDSFLFFCIGLGPVIVIWGGIWVWAGYVKYRR